MQKDQAQVVAQQAITQATKALATNQASVPRLGKLTASPVSGSVPLSMTFSYPFSPDRKAPYINFGDGSESLPMSCTRSGCTLTHVYNPASEGRVVTGTYIAKLIVENANGSSSVIDSTTVILKEDSSVSVPGMSKYTDADFGFSFWYPSEWKVTTVTTNDPYLYPGGMIKKWVLVGPLNNDRGQYTEGFSIAEYNSPEMTITDTISACPMGVCRDTTRYYFDASAHTWMMQYPNGTHSERDGSYVLQPGTTRPADVSNNTMGGLHIFIAGTKADARIIPLSAHNFLVVSPNGYGVYGQGQINAFAKTILATDPTVATPGSAAEQTATIQAEKSAYTSQ